MIKVGIIGATGYAGAELVRILLRHKDVEIKWYGSRSYVDEKYASVYRNMFELVEDNCLDDNIEELADQVDVIFTATPQGYLGGSLNEEMIKKTRYKERDFDKKELPAKRDEKLKKIKSENNDKREFSYYFKAVV